MKVLLKQYSDLKIALEAGLICTSSEDKIDNYDTQDFIGGLVDKGHESVIEHLHYTFKIEGISRALLQELARHRHASLSVQSTRWALKKIAAKVTEGNDLTYPVVIPLDYKLAADTLAVFNASFSLITHYLQKGYAVDQLKYLIPESLPVDLMWSVNARSLRNVFKLRTAKNAFFEFQELCDYLYMAIPKDHRFMYDDYFDRRN